jgi:hypothetical protein
MNCNSDSEKKGEEGNLKEKLVVDKQSQFYLRGMNDVLTDKLLLLAKKLLLSEGQEISREDLSSLQEITALTCRLEEVITELKSRADKYKKNGDFFELLHTRSAIGSPEAMSSDPSALIKIYTDKVNDGFMPFWFTREDIVLLKEILEWISRKERFLRLPIWSWLPFVKHKLKKLQDNKEDLLKLIRNRVCFLTEG